MAMRNGHLTLLGEGEALFEPLALDLAACERQLPDLLQQLRDRRVRLLWYDLSSIALIDAVHLDYLNRLASACRATAVRLVVVNMQPAAAFALAGMYPEKRPCFETALGVGTVIVQPGVRQAEQRSLGVGAPCI